MGFRFFVLPSILLALASAATTAPAGTTTTAPAGTTTAPAGTTKKSGKPAHITCSSAEYELADKRGTDDWCGTKQCSCLNGYGFRGAGCPKHGDYKCASCAESYTLKSDKCEKTVCPLGLYPVGNECQTKKCQCPNGYGTIGTHCKKNGDIDCKNCKYGFTLDKKLNKCVNLGDCKCTNGVAATGSNCPYGGYYKCAQCENGYRKHGNRCLKDAAYQN